MAKTKHTARTTPPAAASANRLPGIDVARGIAIAVMFVYHFCFDLAYFGVLRQNFYNDWRWIAARTLILSSFLLLVGIGLFLGHGKSIRWVQFWRRFALVAGCAALVSAGTYALFPESWVYFGVLHFIAVASVLALPLLRWPTLALVLGIALIVLDRSFKHPWFDQPLMQWFGLMTHKPRTEDYVPMVPWFGVVLVGIFCAARLLPKFERLQRAPSVALTKMLAWAGRHSLLLYMMHQPIFFALLFVALRLR